MLETTYRDQVDLLIDALPFVDKEKCFALKGGTAINLFIRDLPRLSVDIDLTYLPFDGREEALQNISDALRRIKTDMEASNPDATINEVAQRDGTIAKLTIQRERAQIKIEANTVLRGHLYETERLILSDSVQDIFEKFAEITVISQGELFGGKICAALDRQHPRDLFDVHFLLENEGITEHIKYGFISALLGHGRPVHEVISPSLKDQREAFETQFQGMTNTEFSYDDFENIRDRLVDEIHSSLNDSDRELLISFVEGKPKWDLFPHKRLKDLPSIQWKLHNIKKLIEKNPEKNSSYLNLLKDKINR